MFNCKQLGVDPQPGCLSSGLKPHICSCCGARHLLSEKLAKSSQQCPNFGNCCYSGKAQLDTIKEYPQSWHNLLTGWNSRVSHFRKYAQRYNQTLSMASTGRYFGNRFVLLHLNALWLPFPVAACYYFLP